MVAMGKDRYVELLQKGDFDMAAAFKQDYVDLLKHYYYVGGMPEVVQTFADNRDFEVGNTDIFTPISEIMPLAAKNWIPGARG